ncbi:MAG: YqgE/AlgH family protein [Neisseria sp.]|nr:YqgE/AlgH family protein [Neisseria sp.]
MDLTNHFLIAMPDMDDPFFAGSVVYLCRHDEDGALGVVVNKQSPMLMAMVFASGVSRVPERFLDQWIMLGGPVNLERGFVLHSPASKWQNSVMVNEDISLTSSRDIIEYIGQNQSEEKISKLMLTLGCASWQAGQLEQELAENAWLTVKADEYILFDVPPEQRYAAAMAKLGVSEANLMQGAGRA